MLGANEQRFWRSYHEYLDRPGGDYAELLRRGAVSSPEGSNPEAWRAEIRRKARQDKIAVSTSRDSDRAFAIVNRAIAREQEQDATARELERYVALRELRNRTSLLGHELIGWVRHDVESISICGHCGPRLYARTDSEPIEDGEALTPTMSRAPTRRLADVP